MGKGGGVRWWCGQAVQHGAVPCPADAGGEGVVPTTGHTGGRERVATRWHALLKVSRRWWQVWAMVPVSGRGGVRRGVYLMEVSRRWWQGGLWCQSAGEAG